MEDILDLYERPLGPGEGKVCVDERPYQLLADIRPALPMAPGQPAREDYTDERKGTCNLFVVLAPEQGWREGRVTEHRTKEDWGRLLVWLTDEAFPDTARFTGFATISTRTPWEPCIWSCRRRRHASGRSGSVSIRRPGMPAG